MIKKMIWALVIVVSMTSYAYATNVESVGPDFSGYEKAGEYWVKVFINDTRGRLSVRLLNEHGDEDLTDIARIKVTFVDGTEKKVVFRPERIYWDDSEDTYTGEPLGYSGTYYLMGKWLIGLGCVETTIYLGDEEVTFTCKKREAAGK